MFTNQAYIYHILHLSGYINSTYSIALFVFIIGSFLQLYHLNKSTDGTMFQKLFVFMFHLLPLIFIKSRSYHANILVTSLIIYIIYIGSFDKIKKIYMNMYSYLYDKKINNNNNNNAV